MNHAGESCSRSGEATTHLISRSERISRGATGQWSPTASQPWLPPSLKLPPPLKLRRIGRRTSPAKAGERPVKVLAHPMLYPRARPPTLSFSLHELFATCPTIHVSFTSSYGMFLFTTRSTGDTPIHQLAAHRAETHRSVTTAVIQVGTVISLRYHFFSPVGLRTTDYPETPHCDPPVPCALS